jgi:hypothetical protein
MSDADALVERLRRANRRWKTLALAACTAVGLTLLAWYIGVSRAEHRAERMRAEAERALYAARRPGAQTTTMPSNPAP